MASADVSPLIKQVCNGSGSGGGGVSSGGMPLAPVSNAAGMAAEGSGGGRAKPARSGKSGGRGGKVSGGACAWQCQQLQNTPINHFSRNPLFSSRCPPYAQTGIGCDMAFTL